MMKESVIQNNIRLAASKLGIVLFRNTVGMLEDRRGTKVRYGLCVGSSDLIGYTKDGRFIAVEVKRPGARVTPAQFAFLYAVEQAGGIALCSRSVEEFTDAMKERLP